MMSRKWLRMKETVKDADEVVEDVKETVEEARRPWKKTSGSG